MIGVNTIDTIWGQFWAWAGLLWGGGHLGLIEDGAGLGLHGC
jgi:hypothetical protein